MLEAEGQGIGVVELHARAENAAVVLLAGESFHPAGADVGRYDLVGEVRVTADCVPPTRIIDPVSEVSLLEVGQNERTPGMVPKRDRIVTGRKAPPGRLVAG